MKKQNLTYGKLQYILSVPDDFSEDKKYPLIIFFHGAGGRGDDIAVLHQNPYFEVTDSYELEAVTVAPLCHANSWFDIFELLQDFIHYAVSRDFADTKRVYMAGASMGGYATWQMAMTLPEIFAAIVPICGGGMYWNAGRLKDIAVWAYHGSEDKTVLLEESQKMVNAVNANGGNAKLTVCEGVGHNSWMNAYGNRELFTWLLSQTKTKGTAFTDRYHDQAQFG